MRIATIWIVLYIITHPLLGAEELSQRQYEQIEKLEKAIQGSHDELIKTIPADLRNEMLSLKNLEDYYKSRGVIQEWIRSNVLNNVHDEISKILDDMEHEKTIHRDDSATILTECFINRINKVDIQLEDSIIHFVTYWKESNTPAYKISPEGGGKINWIWTLPTEERQNGRIHVGIDESTRRFVCYEQTKGVYYPQGMLMERIRAEIVQNPEASLDHVGRGYIEKVRKSEDVRVDKKE